MQRASEHVQATRNLSHSGLMRGLSGANVAAALRVAQRLGPDATIVTILVDSGLRYVSTDLYRSP